MGSSEEPIIFAKIMQRPFHAWRSARPASQALDLQCGIVPRKLDGGTSVFADDIFDKILVRSGEAGEAHLLTQQSDAHLDTELTHVGLLQNKGKREIVPSFLRSQETKRFKELTKEGKVLPRARYLGGRYAWNLATMEELQYKCSAMRVGWANMGSLWGSRISSKLKLWAFQGHVVEAGLSANKAYVFSAKMTNQMDTIVAK